MQEYLIYNFVKRTDDPISLKLHIRATNHKNINHEI